MAESEMKTPEEAQATADQLASEITSAQEGYASGDLTLEEMIMQIREALDMAEAGTGENQNPDLGGMGGGSMTLPEPEEED